MTNTAATAQHFITETPADWTRYNGRCSCGETFSTNSKSGYTNSTRAHLRATRRDRPAHDGDIVLKQCECGWAVERRRGRWVHIQTDRTACPTAAEVAAWRKAV